MFKDILGDILNTFKIYVATKHLERVVYYHSLPFHHPIHFAAHGSLVMYLSPSADPCQAEAVKWLLALKLTRHFLSLILLDLSVPVGTVAWCLLCEILSAFDSHAPFSPISLPVAFSSLSPLCGPESPAFCVWHLLLFM